MLPRRVVASFETLPMTACHHVAFQRGRRHEEEDDSYHADGACGSYPASLEVLAVRSEADARSRMRKRRGTERPGQRRTLRRQTSMTD
jgi:hypothetical protein